LYLHVSVKAWRAIVNLQSRSGAVIDRPHNHPYSRAMHAELDTIEAKIRQVAELCHVLRRENIALRQQLLNTQQDSKQLTTRLDAARARLQALLETLPEDV
jgi:cell division protein ZapB